MTDYRIEHCRSRKCGARIIWAISTATGRYMPVDADPTPDGNVELATDWPPLGNPTATVHAQPPLDVEERELRLPHHATCPDADSWRRQR